MRLSTKGRYGIKAAIELSKSYGEGPVSVRVLAKRAGISATYLEQLIRKLRACGIVESVRGAHGGYKLKEDPGRVLVGRVLRALEGSVAPMLCAEEGFACDNADACVEAYLYRRIRMSIDEVIDGISLQDLLNEGTRMKRKKKNAPCREKTMEEQRGK